MATSQTSAKRNSCNNAMGGLWSIVENVAKVCVTFGTGHCPPAHPQAAVGGLAERFPLQWEPRSSASRSLIRTWCPS
jgi:hypothetical protein